MRVALVLAALTLLVPGATAAPTPEFPQEVRDLLATWVVEAEALGANDTDRAWYGEAKTFLDEAKQMQAAGRVRAAMYDLETFTELVLAGQIQDEAASLGSDAERKSFAISRATAWHVESKAAWEAYRARLNATEDEIHALHALELTLYSADNALGAALSSREHEFIAREFPKQPGFSRDYLLALVRADHSTLLNFQWANDMLDAAARLEGLPPRINDTAWAQQTGYALQDPGYTTVPAHLEELEKLATPVRANNESVMAFTIALAEQRAARATNIVVIFGDAQSRGMDVVSDAARGMRGQLNNTTMAAPRAHGLTGVFTADAMDRAIFTQSFVERQLADLNIIIAAWSALEHQTYVTLALTPVSPVQPPPPAPTVDGRKAPGFEFAALAAGALALALAMRARRR